ncbi:MAG: hypothetical protein JST64_04280 [Actinobacteria bacterium]|nr:hypothetical protein [Actinomycetota bacterium]
MTIATIGASLAGAKAAEAARETGYDGRIVLIGEEQGVPYELPPSSPAARRPVDSTSPAHLDTRELTAVWQHDGVVTAVMDVEVWDVVEDLRSIAEAHAAVDPERLVDPRIPLRDLLS